MTEIGTIPLSGPSDAHPGVGDEEVARAEAAIEPQSPIRQTIAAVTARTTARIGLAWIAVMALLAVFAPLIANTNPLWIVQDGKLSSPMLTHLTGPDVCLQIGFWTAVALCVGRRLGRVFAVVLLPVAALSCVLAALLVQPPDPVDYDVYRAAIASGHAGHWLYAPLRFSPDDHLRDQPGIRLTAPTKTHPLGITADSADVLSNMIYASRIALSIGFISTGIAVVIGVTLGGLMGYYAGWVDLIGMRLAEIFQSIPTLLLLLCFVAAFGPNLYIMMAIIGFTSWVGYAQFVRAEFLSLRDRDFVHAAVAAGLPTRSILFRHMLPNGITPVLVTASFGVAGAILTESTLSFLGIGLKGEASWGGLLNQALGEGGGFYWWIALYPGLAIFLTVFAYNLIGEALRDALDPKLKERS
jgi:peptide/nickel transport system permease protein